MNEGLLADTGSGKKPKRRATKAVPDKQKKKRILIIDDDPRMREMLGRALSRAGFHVNTAPDGLKLASSLNTAKPDLIVLDVAMSWVNGIELCRLVGSIREYRQVPVVFISGYADAKTVRRCREAGGADFVSKPINLPDFINCVKDHLGIALDPTA